MARQPASDPSLLSIIRNLTAPQAWSLMAAVFALIGGVFAFGMFAESTKQASVLLAKEETLSGQRAQIAELDRSVKELTNALSSTIRDKGTLETKGEFLGRLAYYLSGGDDISKKLLVDVVCSMWKQSETQKIRLDRGPLQISQSDFRRGLSPDVQKFLVSRGVDGALLQRASRDDSGVTNVGPLSVTRIPSGNQERDRALTTVQKQTSNVAIVKVVSFPDGARFELPQEIATIVHTRNDCAPS